MTPLLTYLVVALVIVFVVRAIWLSNRDAKNLGEPSESLLLKLKEEDIGDPISDADRRMAHGAYNEALSIIESAIVAEPSRSELQFKALEILFVWGDGEKFLAVAKEHQHDLEASNEWSRVCILGAEICPNELLFVASSD